jgi:hypothetical protein
MEATDHEGMKTWVARILLKDKMDFQGVAGTDKIGTWTAVSFEAKLHISRDGILFAA